MSDTTDPTLAGLLKAVLAEPDDTFRRLVYADALEERGEADRSEFIRVQCELAKVDAEVESLGPCHCSCHDPTGCERCREGKRRGLWLKWHALRDRERELLTDDNRTDWFAVPGLGVQLEGDSNTLFWWVQPSGPRIKANIGRGFVESVTCTAADWLRHADAILQAQPVRAVTLTTWPDVGDLHDGFAKMDWYEAMRQVRTRPVAKQLRDLFHGITFGLPGDAP